nr:EOG090X06E3 [Eulimnadia texana]
MNKLISSQKNFFVGAEVYIFFIRIKNRKKMFTCVTCQVAFKDADLQRDHYKTDWHRYNLKRKVAELPPVSAETFQQRVLAQRAQAAEQEALQSYSTYCEACRKKFGSEKSYQNHLNSRKHQENLLRLPKTISKAEEADTAKDDDAEMEQDDEEVEEVSSDEWEDEEEAIPVNCCLFCKQESSSMMANLQHMTVAHSFFIPDAEFLTDAEGLLGYLGEKVGQGRICLWCGHKGRQFHSTEAVQKHMTDKGHCKMFHEGEVLVEYADFYDYTPSYPEGEAPAEGDEHVEENVIDDSGYQLVLPSGATIGHRSLARYYRQKLNLNPRPPVLKRTGLPFAAQYKALGWTSSTKEIIEKKARDMRFMQRVFSKHQVNLSVKANKLQKHFRQQVDF